MVKRKMIPDSELRLMILYALKKLGPVTNLQLLQFMVDTDLMNYIEMELNIAVLEEQGSIRHQSHPLGELLTLTPEGDYALEEFDNRVPRSRLTVIDDQAQEWQSRFLNEQQTIADSFPLRDGGTCIRLKLLENDSALMHLMLTVPMPSVTCLEDRWHNAAQQIYGNVYATLSQGFDGSEALPETGDLSPVSDREWLLSLETQTGLQMLLTLPDAQLGRFMASRWPECGESLRLQILQALELTDMNKM